MKPLRLSTTPSNEEKNMFKVGQSWLDTEGNLIQAHGGGVLYFEGMYYWFGENKDGPTYCNTRGVHRIDARGVSCYSSQNLVDWKHEGIVLPAVSGDPDHDLNPKNVIERPKVIYNARTGKFVMWLHIDHEDYAYARTGVAVADSPTGPYEYLRSVQPCGFDSRDMTLYQDQDGVAYVIFSSDWNKTLVIAQLSEDYLAPTGSFTRNFIDQYREAPAVFHYKNTYYMITSGCTGWDPNQALYATASSVLGPWELKGHPCIGHGADTTFEAQSTFVMPVEGQDGTFIFMADRWNPTDLRNSRYVWLPITLTADATLEIAWQPEWALS
jgi:hypothetical protein